MRNIAVGLPMHRADLIYAYDLGDSVQKDEFNAKINAAAPLLYRNGRHYREFFIATRDDAASQRVHAALAKARDEETG